MRFVLTRDPAEFHARTERLFTERIECNVLATVLMNVMAGMRTAPPVFVYGVDERDEVRFAALRAPPWPMLASPLEGGAEELIEVWLRADPDVPGVNGPRRATRAIASAWQSRTGGTVRCSMREALHVLDEVRDPPHPAPGALRLPVAGERGLLLEWMRAFAEEAGLPDDAGRAEATVDFRLERDGLLIWYDGGPVSFVGVSPPIAGTVRIGPVYTPPEYRRRGYAGTAAQASRRALAHGAAGCMLFTDLANPTSNKIYAEVGYRRTGDWEQLSFESAATVAPATQRP